MTRRIFINGSQRDVVSMTFAGLSLSDDDTLKFAKSIKAIDFSDLVVPTIPRGINGMALPHGVGTYSTATTLATSMNGWAIHQCGADIFDFGFCYAGDDGKLHHVEWIGASLKGIGEKADPSQAPSDHIHTFQTRYLFRDGVCMTIPDEVMDISGLIIAVKASGGVGGGDADDDLEDVLVDVRHGAVGEPVGVEARRQVGGGGDAEGGSAGEGQFLDAGDPVGQLLRLFGGEGAHYPYSLVAGFVPAVTPPPVTPRGR
jgi:hypothetical protein